jgi:hypothetical protein
MSKSRRLGIIIAVSPCHIGAPLVRIDLKEGDVGFFVSADHPGRVPAVVLKDRGNLVGIGDDMVVCHDIFGTVISGRSGINPEPGAMTFSAGLGLFEKVIEELVERRAARPERGGALVCAYRPRPGWPVAPFTRPRC